MNDTLILTYTAGMFFTEQEKRRFPPEDVIAMVNNWAQLQRVKISPNGNVCVSANEDAHCMLTQHASRTLQQIYSQRPDWQQRYPHVSSMLRSEGKVDSPAEVVAHDLPQQLTKDPLSVAKRFVRADRHESAILVLDQAIQQKPTAELHDARAIILSLSGRHEEALESFSHALEWVQTDSRRAEIYYHRGIFHAREELYDLALLDLTRACRFNNVESKYHEALDQLNHERRTSLL